MGFIKRGDGKILSVIEAEELTEEQKKAAKDLPKVDTKTSKSNSDNLKSGNNQ